MIRRCTVRTAVCSALITQKLERRHLSIFHRVCSRLKQHAIPRAPFTVLRPVFALDRAQKNCVDHVAEYCTVEAVEESLDCAKFSELVNDSNTERLIKLIIMEYEISKQSGGRVPSTITIDEMKELLQFSSEFRRAKYFNYLLTREKAKLNDERRKERRRIEYEKRKREREAIGPKNSFFLHIREQSMLKFYNSRQAHSMIFGSTLVFDMGYEEYMAKREKVNCVFQISMAYGANKVHRDPFSLYLCNAKSDCETMKLLRTSIPHLHASNCLINVTELSYLDIFPKDRIVYLTPNADEILNNFDHDTVYIVGGFVDKTQPKPLSLAKAKRENLRMAKLPLDYYLHWGTGSKSLTLNQVLDIMLEIKSSNSWKEAFKFVPTRKLQKIDFGAMEITRSKKKASDVVKKLSLLERD